MANPFAAKWKSGESRESIDEIIYAIRDKEEEVKSNFLKARKRWINAYNKS